MDWQFASCLALFTPGHQCVMGAVRSDVTTDQQQESVSCSLIETLHLSWCWCWWWCCLAKWSISLHLASFTLHQTRCCSENQRSWWSSDFKMKIEIAAGDITIQCWWGSESNIHFKSAPDEWGRVWVCVGVFKTWVIIWQFHHMRHMGITKLFLFHLSLRYMREMNHQKQICRYWDNSRKYLHFIT